MKIIKFIIIIITIVLNGCVTILPNVAANGRYSQLFIRDHPVLEIEYQTAEECATLSNSSGGLDNDAKKNIASGAIRLICSPISLKNTLSYDFDIINIATLEKYIGRANSSEVCILISKKSKNEGFNYICQK